METHFVTKEGLEKLKNELQQLQTEGRKQVSDDLEEAIAMGDLRENAAYHEAKERQSLMETRIKELKNLISNAEIIAHDDSMKDLVQLGSKITITTDDGLEKTFTIVGSNEADPMHGLISNESPLGRAFIGHKKKDKVEVQVPKGTVVYTITKID